MHDEKGGFTLVVSRSTKAGGILSMALLHEHSKFMCTAHNSGTIKVWDCVDFLEMRKILAGTLPIHKIKMWRHLMVSVGADREVKFWNTETWCCVATGIGHGKTIYDICTTATSTCLNGVAQDALNDDEQMKPTDPEVASILATVGADGKWSKKIVWGQCSYAYFFLLQGQLIFWDPMAMIEHQKQKRNSGPMKYVKAVQLP